MLFLIVLCITIIIAPFGHVFGEIEQEVEQLFAVLNNFNSKIIKNLKLFCKPNQINAKKKGEPKEMFCENTDADFGRKFGNKLAELKQLYEQKEYQQLDEDMQHFISDIIAWNIWQPASWSISTAKGHGGGESSHHKSEANTHQKEPGKVKQQFIEKVAELNAATDLNEAGKIAHEIQEITATMQKEGKTILERLDIALQHFAAILEFWAKHIEGNGGKQLQAIADKWPIWHENTGVNV